MKICTKCNINKPFEAFYSKSGRKNEFMSQCKECFNISTHERQKKNKLNYVAYKGGCCQLCGYNKCVEALDFHHLDPDTKDLNLSSGRGFSFKRAKAELDKCILLCANCHREVHSEVTEITSVNTAITL